MRAKGSRGAWIGSLTLIGIGVVLLLNNFLLISGFNVSALWPLLLVIGGAVVLLRGDLLGGGEGRAFGITRGSVESATLEISAAEIDVSLTPLQREGRLIAGQYAANARPALHVQGTHTFLKMDRAATPWLSFANWDMALAPDLPWQVLVSASLGQVSLDLSGLIVQNALVSTGLGDIRLVTPLEAFEPLYVRSAVGTITVIAPEGSSVQIHAPHGVFFKVHADPARYERLEPGLYRLHNSAAASIIDVYVSGTFGDAYLA
ncbi:MAG: hypothetical protein SF162_05635 [bacterium]|nr:hypothetical protein [bacterium]